MAVRLAEGKPLDHVQITKPLVEELKGPPKFQPELAELKLTPGIGVGLGASGAGGELLLVEVRKMPGKGGIRVTGSLGPILKEAANTAVSFVRSKSEELKLDPEWIKKIDLHVHIPRAQAVYDFAGCGLTIFSAVCSLLLENSCRGDVAVIGELTLRGSVLPVDDVRAMLFAAQRAGVKEVIIPSKNRSDVEETPKEVTSDLSIRYIDRVDEVLPLVLQPPLLENDQILSAASRPPARA